MDEIPVKIGRLTKWISGINENTKCVEVVTVILLAEGLLDIPEEDVNNHFALVEMWGGVTKVLSGNSPILRIWRAWADEQPNVCFKVKRIRNPKHEREPSITKPNAGGNNNLIEKMRNHVKAEEVAQKAKAKITRRNSSINRQKRPPDTFHPNAHTKNKQELCESIEEKLKLLREEILRLQKLKTSTDTESKVTIQPENTKAPVPRLPIRDTSFDTSEDSGIVTDDSEAKSNQKTKKYFEIRRNTKVLTNQNKSILCEPKSVNNETSDLPSKTPSDEPLLREWVATMDKINELNKLLEEKEEQIIALQYEYKIMQEERCEESSPLDCFNTEVVKYREINAQLLEDITTNRKKIEQVNEKQKVQNKVINQLEFDINIVEREGKRLESGLNSIQNLEISVEENVDSETYSSLPIRLNSNNIYSELPLTLPNIHGSKHHETNSELPVSTLV